MAYVGAGTGFDRARISFPTMPNTPAVDGSDRAWVGQGIAGVEIAIGPAAALYGEYQLTRLQEHEFLLSTQKNVLSARPSHIVVGIRVGR